MPEIRSWAGGLKQDPPFFVRFWPALQGRPLGDRAVGSKRQGRYDVHRSLLVVPTVAGWGYVKDGGFLLLAHADVRRWGLQGCPFGERMKHAFMGPPLNGLDDSGRLIYGWAVGQRPCCCPQFIRDTGKFMQFPCRLFTWSCGLCGYYPGVEAPLENAPLIVRLDQGCGVRYALCFWGLCASAQFHFFIRFHCPSSELMSTAVSSAALATRDCGGWALVITCT